MTFTFRTQNTVIISEDVNSTKYINKLDKLVKN